LLSNKENSQRIALEFRAILWEFSLLHVSGLSKRTLVFRLFICEIVN
jgi:hypothetical protein